MRLLTHLELSRCTKAGLWKLYRESLFALADLPEGSPKHRNALLNIRRIRQFLARLSCAGDVHGPPV